jgi:hypothetical protein
MLDTLGKVMPPPLPGESAYQRDYRIGSALKRVTDDDSGRSLLVNHHDRKAAADDFVASFQALTAWLAQLTPRSYLFVAATSPKGC